MSWLQRFWELLVTPEGAGSVGSLLSLRWAPGDSWLGKLSGLVGGFAFAIYIVPLLVEHMEIKSTKGPLAMAFVGGLVGMNVLAKVWMLAQKTSVSDLRDFLLRVIPGKKAGKGDQ